MTGPFRRLTAALLLAAAPPLAGLALLPSLPGCRPPEADRLHAVLLESPPVEENWEEGIPLSLKAGGGNVHGRKTVLDRLDPAADPIHSSSASCHHGPPVTDPVPVEVRAFHDRRNIYVEVSWDDPTEDVTPKRWLRGEKGWEVSFHEGDGVAILWGRVPGEYGCQEACHVDDWAVRGGSLVDVRSMYLAGEGAWEEAWVWKAGGGTGGLIIGPSGFATAAGEPYRTLNSAAAGDASLGREVRRARTFAAGDGPVIGTDGKPVGRDAETAPAYLWGKGLGDGSLTVEARRREGGWRVRFSRPLDLGGRRQAFLPGEDYRFGVAVFDDTTLNHHIVRDAQTLRLQRSRLSGAPR